MTPKWREFWATQLIGSEDGNYFMSVDKDVVEKMSHVEVPFKVIEHSALLDLQRQLDEANRRIAELEINQGEREG